MANNRDIDNFLLTSEFLEIESMFGYNALNRYLEELMFLENGGKYKDLGIGQRRKEAAMSFLVPTDGAYSTVGRYDIQDGMVPKGSIAMLNLSGVMRTQSGLSSQGADSFVNDLREAYANPNVSGVIINTFSGGGESSAGNMIKNAIQERNKPVVGLATMAASAAYRALSGADEIIAAGEQSEFGSIGTMISIDNKMLEKLRGRITDIYGEDAPNKNGEYRAAMEGDLSKLQERVTKLTKSFHDEIKRDRPLRGGDDMIKDTLSGSMFDANEAQKRGLIDAVGNLPFAIKRVNALKSKY